MTVIVKDSNGATLSDGDSVTVIKDLKVKGSSTVLKRGTVIKNIRLTGDPGEIEGRTDKVKGPGAEDGVSEEGVRRCRAWPPYSLLSSPGLTRRSRLGWYRRRARRPQTLTMLAASDDPAISDEIKRAMKERGTN